VLVLCGSGSTLDSIGRLVYSVRHTGSKAPLYEYRGSMPVTGAHKVPSLGDSPTDAVRHIRALIDGPSQRHLRSAVS
jgi:hypothetical protein